MNRISLYTFLALVGMIFFGVNEASAQKPVFWTASDLKWMPMPNSGGVMTATLWGDQTKGPYGAFNKFPAGFKAPLHYHTNAAKIVVIKGAYTYNGKQYGSGSFLDIPGGDKHESGGVADSETIFFIEQSGNFDLVPVDMSGGKK